MRVRAAPTVVPEKSKGVLLSSRKERAQRCGCARLPPVFHESKGGVVLSGGRSERSDAGARGSHRCSRKIQRGTSLIPEGASAAMRVRAAPTGVPRNQKGGSSLGRKERAQRCGCARLPPV